jgi:hypothetical protein
MLVMYHIACMSISEIFVFLSSSDYRIYRDLLSITGSESRDDWTIYHQHNSYKNIMKIFSLPKPMDSIFNGTYHSYVGVSE